MRKIPAWHLSYVHKQGVIFVYMSRSKNTVVACYTLEGQLVKTYQTAKLAARSRHLYPRTIDRCIRGDLSTVKNLQWKRFNIGEVPSSISPIKKESTILSIRPVAKLDENENIIEVYPSIRNAAKNNHIDAHTLRDRLNKKYAYIGKAKFRYLLDNEIDKYAFKKGQEINNKTKAIIQLTLDDKYVKSYPSISAALKALNKSPTNRGISQCLKGNYETAFGYKWKYKNYENVPRLVKKKTNIYALDDNNKIIKKYNSAKEAATTLGVSVSSINNAIRLGWRIKGYHWKRK